MTRSPHYGAWDPYNVEDGVAWNEDGSPYVRPTRYYRDPITSPIDNLMVYVDGEFLLLVPPED